MSIIYPDDGSSRILSNVSTILPDYMASCLTRQQKSSIILIFESQMGTFKDHAVTANGFSSTAHNIHKLTASVKPV
jgi:cobyrinic acid a,c-diamide synthase